ncbi:signal transduction histidine kinase [Nonomuraea polychroma]|uniref:Signal transduction histidine kinase n=1 Tax=Nonomuraea polychroma TaxID=46176 RepID=A0A438MLI0_9ACTN|nr:histidine kinase [Nonomuraea polychroma]RVX46622.1 signal transduction histidine kinase [Nonomuraea polychroma]
MRSRLVMMGDSVAGAAAAATLAGFVLRLQSSAGFADDYWLWISVTAMVYGAPGAFLIRRGRTILGWLFVAVSASAATSAFTGEYATAAAGRGWPGHLIMLWLSVWSWLPAYVIVAAVVPYWLPSGERPTGVFRPLMYLGCASVVAGSAAWALLPWQHSDDPALADSGLASPLSVAGAEALLPVCLVMVAVAALGGLASLGVRLRRAESDERGQLAWVGAGMAGTVLLLVAAQTVEARGAGVLLAASALPLPISVVLAIQRYRMWDMETVLRRGLVWALMSAEIALCYAVVVALLGDLLGRSVGAPLVAAAVVAISVAPVHRLLQRGVRRLLYGDAADPYDALGRLGATLETAAAPAEALERLAGDVARILRVPAVWVLVLDGPESRHGEELGADPVRVPLVHAGEAVGELLLTRPRAGEFRPAEARLLHVLARQAGAAAHAARLAADLDRSRRALVTARAEERRRLRRDLHDQLGPSLSAVHLQLETLRDMVATDPAGAGALADRCATWLAGAVGDVRRIVDGLGPSALDDLGLAEALRAQTAGFSRPGLAVRLRLPEEGLPPLPAATEAAVLRIVGEALANTARHARASGCDVEVELAPDALHFSVRDDGVGVTGTGAGWRVGVGLESMAEAAAQLDGKCEILAAAGGGTEVRVRLPRVEV